MEMPEVGTELEKGEQLTVLESVKAVAEVYTSVSGKVTEINEELESAPNLINDDPLGKGTIITSLPIPLCGFLHILYHFPLLPLCLSFSPSSPPSSSSPSFSLSLLPRLASQARSNR